MTFAIDAGGRDNITVILNTEYRIVSDYKAATARLGNGGPFTAQELDYILNTFSAILQHGCWGRQRRFERRSHRDGYCR